MGLNGPATTGRFQRGSFYPNSFQSNSMTFNRVLHLTYSDDFSMLLKVDASKNREDAHFGSLPGRNHSFVPQVAIWKHLMITLALFLLLRVRMEL